MVENDKKSYDNGRIYCIRNSVSNDIYIYWLYNSTVKQANAKTQIKHDERKRWKHANISQDERNRKATLLH